MSFMLENVAQLTATVYCQSWTVSDFCQLNDWWKDVTWFLTSMSLVRRQIAMVCDDKTELQSQEMCGINWFRSRSWEMSTCMMCVCVVKCCWAWIAGICQLAAYICMNLIECLNVYYHVMSQISVFLMLIFICVNSRPTEHVRSVYEVASIIFRWYKVVETSDCVHQLILQISSLWSGFVGQWQLIIYHLIHQIKYRSVLNSCFLLQMWCGSTFGCICHCVSQGHQSRSRSQK